ncbi:MAG: hypothetical protein UU65_C0002G0220 [candidate division CPR2 bacterium GW2011_GWC1_41_48]|uniref:Uncharacterized protein n=1 Tax=candidate division CPR2 bacterium GW2011_GWC1_41_48 TaxID=1618344 RepID=A0A0G0WBJ7_UNCC2|nr:MAG: hypothetical protein UT47_C0002G0084 [candidate division CPR2 bacterium GW2011_GWC2_39_35]KKR27572.1 MAG: hypothetical protein UT60_C0045G0008 [candidate division CPR2 bacterium GW2011_GWD2_39_7]KKR29585.1 MAG: hypothetical protein UT59_C0004G0011 [candidate division CPR2 bacterium GW2011_GWD1_39_7]KKS09442.1 MAG: hypothetical protein UU65_C0002G0220 [candidate division CPR2 bacterium GW2011_GWC1_41_48]OGB55907.1 MAG: hypothetical protein A2Y27_00685 [candidate division CPR2 bacterium G
MSDEFNEGRFSDEELKEYEKIHQIYFDNKGFQKMWNYFLDITKKEYFNDVIKELRKKYEIPPNGYKPDEDGCYRFPPRNTIFEDNFQKELALRNEIIEKICRKYQLHNFDFSDVVLRYVFYNYIELSNQLGACGLFIVSDVIKEKEDPFSEFVQQSDDMAYPIAIRISPYASQRDLIDFIKNKIVWKKEIEFLQNKYKDKNIKIGRVKAKNQSTQERNDFIYQNRDKTLKEVRELLADKNIFLDDGHIAKIISLEKQKRKEV